MRTSAATALDEARNVGKGRIRIFLGPRLNVIFRRAERLPLRPDNDVCSGIVKEKYFALRLIWRPLPGLRRFHYIYELAWTRQRKISAREMIHPSFRDAEHLHTDRDVDQVSAMLIL